MGESQMQYITSFMLLCSTAASVAAAAEESQPDRTVRITVVLRGADNEEDIETLLKALRSVRGVKVADQQVNPGFRRFNNRFTTPIIVSVPMVPGDDDANIGQLATAVSKAKTGSRKEHPPGVNLILFTDDELQEQSISSLRSALNSVNGVEVNTAGGLGGNIQDGWCWIRLEDDGGAMLKEVEQKAQNSGVRLRRLKNPQSEK